MPSRSKQFCALLAMAMALGHAASKVRAQDASQSAAPSFAPGVLTTIPPDVTREDTVRVHDIVELRADTRLERNEADAAKTRTLHEMTSAVEFRRDIWCLELSFKPLRMLRVDIPQPTGKAQRKLIWYLVYRVRNTGTGLAPERQANGTYAAVAKSADSVRFVPQFFLTSQDLDSESKRVRKAYLDRIIPSALQAIRRRELPRGELLNSVQISERMLQLEGGRAMGGLWGVATWEDVDPKLDFFSVFVGGLTNAYDWTDADGFQLGDPPGKGRKFQRKQLQLNFWRPGDAYAEDEREIRFGVAPGQAALYDAGPGVAYQWVYR